VSLGRCSRSSWPSLVRPRFKDHRPARSAAVSSNKKHAVLAIVEVLALIAAVSSLAACTRIGNAIAQVDVSVSNPVWLRDGWIYFLRQANSDAPWQIWRSHPDGSKQSQFAAPALPACPHTTFVFLFEGPHGRVGAGTSCPGDKEKNLVEYSTDGSSAASLGTVPYAIAATWRDGEKGGYVEQITESCWGIAPLDDAASITFTEPISLNGLRWSVNPRTINYACDHIGKAKSPAVTRDGGSVYFLASADESDDSLDGRNAYTLSWRLYRWDKNASLPVMIGPVLTGANGLRLAPDDLRAAVAVHGPRQGITIVNLKDGSTTDMFAGVNVRGLDFSPDGRAIVALTISGSVEIRSIKK
jgi:hypothetical protein